MVFWVGINVGNERRSVKTGHLQIYILSKAKLNLGKRCIYRSLSSDVNLFEPFTIQILQHCGKWLEARSVFTMDNASFHQSDRTKQSFSEAGVRSRYFPPDRQTRCISNNLLWSMYVVQLHWIYLGNQYITHDHAASATRSTMISTSIFGSAKFATTNLGMLPPKHFIDKISAPEECRWFVSEVSIMIVGIAISSVCLPIAKWS